MKLGTKYLLIEKLLFPFLIVVITAVAGSIVGYFIQNRQFRQTTLFKAKFDLMFESRKESVNLLIEFEKVFAQIKANENFIVQELATHKTDNDFREYYCRQEFFVEQILELQSVKYKLDFIESYSKGLSDTSSTNSIKDNISIFREDLGNYISCLQNRHNSCEISCSDNSSDLTKKLQEVVDTYTKELHLFVESNN